MVCLRCRLPWWGCAKPSSRSAWNSRAWGLERSRKKGMAAGQPGLRQRPPPQAARPGGTWPGSRRASDQPGRRRRRLCLPAPRCALGQQVRKWEGRAGGAALAPRSDTGMCESGRRQRQPARPRSSCTQAAAPADSSTAGCWGNQRKVEKNQSSSRGFARAGNRRAGIYEELFIESSRPQECWGGGGPEGPNGSDRALHPAQAETGTETWSLHPKGLWCSLGPGSLRRVGGAGLALLGKSAKPASCVTSPG